MALIFFESTCDLTEVPSSKTAARRFDTIHDILRSLSLVGASRTEGLNKISESEFSEVVIDYIFKPSPQEQIFTPKMWWRKTGRWGPDCHRILQRIKKSRNRFDALSRKGIQFHSSFGGKKPFAKHKQNWELELSSRIFKQSEKRDFKLTASLYVFCV